MTTVLVFGGRNYNDRRTLFRSLDVYHKRFDFDLLIQGGASGADWLAKQWAESRGVRCEQEDALWDDIDIPGAVVRFRMDKRTGERVAYNAAAGAIRNQKMLDDYDPDIAIEFPGNNGTEDMHNKCVAWGVHPLDGEDP